MDEDTPPYDCNMPGVEPRPETVTFQPKFEALEHDCMEMIQRLKTLLGAASFDGPVKDALLTEIIKRTPESLNNECEFAIVGEMAAGKSSLINSLCGRGIIAKRGDSGKSCTWVVHRYRRPFKDQNHPFTARINFFPRDDISKIMEDSLQRWYRAKPFESDEQCHEDVDLGSKLEDNIDRRDIVNTLSGLFRDQKEFSTGDKISEFLHTAECEDNPLVIDRLVCLACQLVECTLAGQPYVELNASRPNDLAFWLRKYTTQFSADSDAEPEPAMWPLIASVDIGIDAVLLNGGITLVDLPGTSDVQRFRRRIAAKERDACSHQIVVADISRALDDNALMTSLVQKYHVRGPGYTVLVMTRADEVDKQSDLEFSASQIDILEDLGHRKNRLCEEKSSLAAQRKSAEREERRDIDETLRATKLELIAIDQKLTTLRQSVRSDFIIKNLNKEYKENSGNTQTLPIYAVGNRDYSIWANGFEAEYPPSLSLEATGIPSLRQKLLALPSEARLNRVIHLATQQLPALLNTFELYCTRSHMDNQAEIRAILEEPKLAMRDAVVDELSAQLLDLGQTHVLSTLRTGESAWVVQARDECRKWAQMHPGGAHLSMLKRCGHKTGGRRSPTINWNEDLIHLSNAEIQECCDPFHRAVSSSFDAFIERSVNSAMQGAHRKITSDDRFNLLALKPFISNFKHIQEELRTATQQASRTFRKETSTILGNLLMYSESAFIVAPMNRIYAEVSLIKGQIGAPDRRRQVLQQRVTRMGGVWTTIHDNVEVALERLVNATAMSLACTLEAIYDGLLRDFDMMCQGQVAVDQEKKDKEDDLRAKLSIEVTAQRARLEGPIQDNIKFCREYNINRKTA